MSQPDHPDPTADIAARLIDRARRAAVSAYAPYSRFHVGCAIESIDGEVVVGANMENACYRLGICAEIAALAAANQAFGLSRVARIAVVGGRIGQEARLVGEAIVMPCGACRQSIHEAAQQAGRDIEVIAANGHGDAITVSRISELLPFAFGQANLRDADPRLD